MKKIIIFLFSFVVFPVRENSIFYLRSNIIYHVTPEWEPRFYKFAFPEDFIGKLTEETYPVLYQRLVKFSTNKQNFIEIKFADLPLKDKLFFSYFSR